MHFALHTCAGALAGQPLLTRCHWPVQPCLSCLCCYCMMLTDMLLWGSVLQAQQAALWLLTSRCTLSLSALEERSALGAQRLCKLTVGSASE